MAGGESMRVCPLLIVGRQRGPGLAVLGLSGVGLLRVLFAVIVKDFRYRFTRRFGTISGT